MKPAPRVLLVGYNGANNTGAEARVVAAIDDLRAVLGPHALLTVPTLNPANTRRYLHDRPNVEVVPIPTVYFLPMRNLVRRHDLILLVEGSVYMDSWSSMLLWYFLWPTRLAHAYGKPCVAYAVDVGTASSANRRHIRREANKTDLIITRTYAAAETLREWGVTAPMDVTADTAVGFPIDAPDQGLLAREWPQAKRVVGLSMVDFYRFPAVIRPWGRAADRYRWPFYFAHSRARRAASARLAHGYTQTVDRLTNGLDRHVALICMEELDEPLARRVQAEIHHPERTRIFSARDYNASQMTAVLSEVEALITARYHGSVLALRGLRPQLAFGHDLRLKTLYQELGLYVDYFIDAHAADRFDILNTALDGLLGQPDSQLPALRHGYEDQLARAHRNRGLLARFAAEHGWAAPAWAA